MGDVADADSVRRRNREARVVKGKTDEQVLQMIRSKSEGSLETLEPTKRPKLEA